MIKIKSLVRLLMLAILSLCWLQTASAETVSTIRDGFGGALGGDFSHTLNQYFFVERGTGNIWRFDLNGNTLEVIGSGYDEPTDIVVAGDAEHAYVVSNEGTGNLLLIDLDDADRSSASVVATGLGAGGLVGQMALDEAHGLAYVIENSRFGALWRVNLGSGATTSLTETFDHNPFGVLLNADASAAYVSELGGAAGKIIRIDLQTSGREEVATGFFNPLYLAWASPAHDAILVAEAAVGRVARVDLTTVPASVSPLLTSLPDNNTRSVTPISQEKLIVVLHGSLLGVNLSPYDASGPTILGIGHVPFDRIVGGYADTTTDPDYFFQVKDAPFGGTLSLMINHDAAFNAPNDARWYQVLVDGVEQSATWNDFLWNGTRFALATMIPHVFDGHLYYRVRDPSEIWFKPWLGYRLGTRGFGNGPHTITVNLFSGSDMPGSQVGTDSLGIEVDNQRPTAVIDEIRRGGIPVSTCGIVTGACSNDKFTFRITATDDQSHMRSWRLTALWGDNKSDLVDSDSYSSHLPGPLWAGVTNAVVPAPAWDAYVPGDPTSAACAHTFELRAWDRAINGYNHIHHTRYHKSITIMLSCP